jgi:hypothetical protein
MDVDRDSIHGQIALAFAKYLTDGRFDDAHAMLSKNLQQQYLPSDLRHEYSEMISYGDSAPDIVELITTMETWPARQKDDLGWAYVAISGHGFSEAVTVVVAQEHLNPTIRELEWGRP